MAIIRFGTAVILLLGLGMSGFVSAQVEKSSKVASPAVATESPRLCENKQTRIPTSPKRLPNLPKSDGASNSSSFESSHAYSYRIPGTTIDLRIATTGPVANNALDEILLRIWDYVYKRIRAEGDGPLPPKEDPFGWKPSGSPGGTKLAFEAASAPGGKLTWSVLNAVLGGLHTAMPSMGRNFVFTFQIWDVADGVLLGRGWLRKVFLFSPSQDLSGVGGGGRLITVNETMEMTALQANPGQASTSKGRRSARRRRSS